METMKMCMGSYEGKCVQVGKRDSPKWVDIKKIVSRDIKVFFILSRSSRFTFYAATYGFNMSPLPSLP